MSEKRLVDVNVIKLCRVPHDMSGYTDLDDVEEYIDRLPTIDPETLPIVQELRERIKTLNQGIENLSENIKAAYENRDELREKLAECEPVHAHWETVPNRVVEHGEMEIRGTAEWCSACKRADKDFQKWFDHCPNCGAIMDEGVFDDTETICEADDGHGGTAE